MSTFNRIKVKSIRLLFLFIFISKLSSSQYKVPDNYTGQWVTKYDNGAIRSKENYKNGQEEGEQIGYYESGKVWVKKRFVDGEPDGQWISYYENSRIWTIKNFIEGREDGVWFFYFDNGQLDSKKTYSNGRIKDGDFISYFENGKIKERGTFKNGELNGAYFHYYPNGEIQRMDHLVYGKQIGEMVYFDEKCRIVKTSMWVNEKETNIVEYKEVIVPKLPVKAPVKKKGPSKAKTPPPKKKA